MKDIKKGVYITELFGSGFNSVTGDFSKGGSGFLIENGEITYPINEITVAGNIKDMFKEIILANDLEFKSRTNSPTLRINNISIAGKEMNKIDLVKRIFRTQVKRYIPELSLTFLFIILTSLTTAATAWLLDPAIKEIFENKNIKMLYFIPLAIVLTFVIKAFSIYGTRIVTIKVGIKIIKNIQTLMAKKFLLSDISHITKKHSGKYLSNFTTDTGILFGVLTGVVVTLFKETFTLIALLGLMFYHDWQLSLLAIIMIPIAALSSKNLGKKMGKKVYLSLEASDKFMKFLSEMIKGSWLIKIYQKEEEELKKISMVIDERFKAIRKVEQTRLGAGPIMEIISSIAIAIVVFFAGYRSMQGAITLGQFVSFLAALMLAYQPVRALAGINIGIQ
jgi:subfamily B ATP-binding cassette protein MsbA